jgi:Raf kinase inhibitor-like YbhB/YbcL family protein
MIRGLTSINAFQILAAAGVFVAAVSVLGASSQQQESSANMAPARLGAPAPTMKVTSAAFAANAAIPEKNSGYSNGPSPQLSWSGAPPSTRTFAIILEDPDAKAVAPQPFLHWLAYNIPATTMTLPEGVPPAAAEIKGGGMQGANGTKASGYFGPRPPAGDPDHHYHFQVFALDAELPLKPGANKADVLAAMQGHVLAWGELVGTYGRKK